MKRVEISIKEILVFVLRRWKPIAAFACVLALFLGVYAYLQQDSGVADTASGLDTAAATDKVVGSSNRSTTLSFNIDLINFNPDVGIAKNEIFASLGARYLIVAQGAPLAEIWDGIAPEAFGDADLHNYIEVESPSVGIFNIIVAEADGIDSRTAAEALYGYLLDQTETFARAVHEHKLSILATSETVSTPEPNSESKFDFKPFGAAYIGSAIMGLLIGLVIGILTAMFFYLVKLPIQTPEQIQRQLNVRYLGGVRMKKRLSLGDSLAGSLRLANEEQAMKIISANLSEFAGNYKRILVTGTISEALIKEFVEKIMGESKAEDVYFSYGADINKDANTIAKLADSDTVVLVERLDVSRLKRVNEEKDRLDMSGKEILGYVLY